MVKKGEKSNQLIRCALGKIDTPVSPIYKDDRKHRKVIGISTRQRLQVSKVSSHPGPKLSRTSNSATSRLRILGLDADGQRRVSLVGQLNMGHSVVLVAGFECLDS
jgi:hypothetical protein